MTRRIPAVCVVLALLGAVPATAQTPNSPENPLLTLRGLVAACNGSDPVSIAACGGYITGFVWGSHKTSEAAGSRIVAGQVARGMVAPTEQAIDAASTKVLEESTFFCITSSWTAGYVQAVVGQYGREHADVLDDMASDHMLNILAKAFPCDQANP